MEQNKGGNRLLPFAYVLWTEGEVGAVLSTSCRLLLLL